jgi:hypothetical protein
VDFIRLSMLSSVFRRRTVFGVISTISSSAMYAMFSCARGPASVDLALGIY